MKKVILMFVFLFTTPLLFNSCRTSTEKETVIKEVEVKEGEGILERTAKKVDTEVNKKIDKEIEKIGDDN